MRWRSITVYWLAAATVWTYVFWTVDRRGGIALVEEKQELLAPIVDAAASTIDVVRIERPELLLELRKQEGRWHVVEPPATAVSSDLVAALLDTLTTIAPVEILAEDPDSLLPFGLDPPRTIIRMASGAMPVAAIELGDRNPTRTAVYARRAGQRRVYLLGLNAQYYVELIHEQAHGLRSSERVANGIPADARVR